MTFIKTLTSDDRQVELHTREALEKLSSSTVDRLAQRLESAADHLVNALAEGLDVTVALLPLEVASMRVSEGTLALMDGTIADGWALTAEMAESASEDSSISIVRAWRDDFENAELLAFGHLDK